MHIRVFVRAFHLFFFVLAQFSSPQAPVFEPQRPFACHVTGVAAPPVSAPPPSPPSPPSTSTSSSNCCCCFFFFFYFCSGTHVRVFVRVFYYFFFVLLFFSCRSARTNTRTCVLSYFFLFF